MLNTECQIEAHHVIANPLNSPGRVLFSHRAGQTNLDHLGYPIAWRLSEEFFARLRYWLSAGMIPFRGLRNDDPDATSRTRQAIPGKEAGFSLAMANFD